jgi:hypothetical protein
MVFRGTVNEQIVQNARGTNMNITGNTTVAGPISILDTITVNDLVVINSVVYQKNVDELNIHDTIAVTDVSIAIGKGSGRIDQNTNSIAIGDNSGANSQGMASIAIGSYAGNSNQETDSVAIGREAGQTSQGENCIAIGAMAGVKNQTANSIVLNALGSELNTDTTGLYVKPIRPLADVSTLENLYYNTKTGEVSSNPYVEPTGSTITDKDDDVDYNLVFSTGAGNGKALHVDSVQTPCTINPNTGNFSIVDTIAVTDVSIAIGKGSGHIDQNMNSIAIGNNSGANSQKSASIAIGSYAGNSNQETDSVAIGREAGQTSQGANCIAIGALAGVNNQTANSIILNANNTSLDVTTGTGFYVKPIRPLADVSTLENLYYNTETGEIATGTKEISTDPVYTTGYNAKLGGYVINISPDGKHGIVSASTDWYGGSNWLIAKRNASLWDTTIMDTNEINFFNWRLPTEAELKVMYYLKSELNLIYYYWSSTETDSDRIMITNMDSASYNTTWSNKWGTVNMRAVRTF